MDSLLYLFLNIFELCLYMFVFANWLSLLLLRSKLLEIRDCFLFTFFPPCSLKYCNFLGSFQYWTLALFLHSFIFFCPLGSFLPSSLPFFSLFLLFFLVHWFIKYLLFARNRLGSGNTVIKDVEPNNIVLLLTDCLKCFIKSI